MKQHIYIHGALAAETQRLWTGDVNNLSSLNIETMVWNKHGYYEVGFEMRVALLKFRITKASL